MGIRKTEGNDQHYAFLLSLRACDSAITQAIPLRPQVRRAMPGHGCRHAEPAQLNEENPVYR
ncbi:hypothetical protein [Burkholderia ubonensis]|uniref:hypothetical protein n=1 Tax=Burkholderia ubonensis TaxID=101571 RepID=UPI000AAD0455|nr:hypothetical protein [Burkholderia ubonensis]